jgi:hypothetical protein
MQIKITTLEQIIASPSLGNKKLMCVEAELWLWSVEAVPWGSRAVEAELSAVAVVCGGRALVRGVEPWRPCVDSVQAKLGLRSKNCTYGCESALIPVEAVRLCPCVEPVQTAEAPLDLVGGAALFG